MGRESLESNSPIIQTRAVRLHGENAGASGLRAGVAKIKLKVF